MSELPATVSHLAGETIQSILTQAPGNGAAIQQLDKRAKAIWRNEGNPN